MNTALIHTEYIPLTWVLNVLYYWEINSNNTQINLSLTTTYNKTTFMEYLPYKAVHDIIYRFHEGWGDFQFQDDGNQNHHTKNFNKHMWLFFHRAAYLRHDIPLKDVFDKV
jgi:hypothetical protein